MSLKSRFNQLRYWKPTSDLPRLLTIDTHTGGEPLRIIVGGYPELEGDTILARRQFALEHLDHYRTALMWEPRGHADMYGCLVTEPVAEGADFGVLFLHNEGYSSMCGHGIIAITRVAVETGLVEMTEPETTVKIDTPAGLVTSHAFIDHGQVKSVRFHNVPSYVVSLDDEVAVDGLGEIKYDLAFGGAYYAFVDVSQVGLSCYPEDHDRLIDFGRRIKKAVMESRTIEHPFEEDLDFLYGTVFIGGPEVTGHHSRNVCVFAEGELDRSPTGTGVSARMAIHYARGEVGIGDPLIIESIIGSTFTGRVVKEVEFGPHKAIVPQVEGTAFVTGCHEFVLDPDDPLQTGFFLR